MAGNNALPTAFSTLLALALIPAFWPSGAMAQEACTDESTDLIADATVVVATSTFATTAPH